MDTLLYLVYGDVPEYQLELTYSISTAVRHQVGGEKLRIGLVTDMQNRRDDLPVEHLIFTSEDFADWTENGLYNHAAKVGAFLKALEHFGGRVALVDTDTYFRSDPRQIFGRMGANGAVMHELEGTLNDQGGYWNRILQSFQQYPFPGYDLSGDSPMYNSGVIGVRASMRSDLLEVQPYIKHLHKLDSSVHNIEQFAFGDVIRRRTGIAECQDIVRHYYGYGRHFTHCRLRDRFPTFTRAEFEQSVSDHSDVEGYPSKGIIDRVRAKLVRSARKEMGIYSFAYLAYLRSFKEKRQDFANAWSATAIDIIRWNRFAPENVVRDFRKMRGPALASYSWLKPETTDLWQKYWSSMNGEERSR